MEDKNEILALKAKVMLQKIDKLRNIYIMILQNSNSKEINSLEIIKKQYLRMYDKLIEKGEYKKYKEIEDTVIKEISKLELKLDEYVYNTIQNYQEIIMTNIQRIKKSKNYENFQNMGEVLNNVETLKELLKLYSPYISKSEEKKIQYEIVQLKFDILFRKQVEELIYQNGSIINNLTQYNSALEKEIFKKLLEEKINSIRPVSMTPYEDDTGQIDVPTIIYKSGFIDRQIKDDEIFETSTEQILSDSRLLERLIIIDMKKNPNNYINLLKAKVFNAHLCNIGNNPFEEEIYLTEEQLLRLGYWEPRYGYSGYGFNGGLKANKVNYSLLVAILKSVITDENISIIECENLYKKFGFECRPILVNIGQQCIKMIFDDVIRSKEFQKNSKDFKKDKEIQEENYCKIDFIGLIYEFDNEEKNSDNLLNQVLNKRRKIKLTSNIPKRRFCSKKQEMPEQKNHVQEEKEKVKERGIITTDIDVIISLIKEIIDKYNTEIQEYERYKIGEAKNKIEWLEDLKNRNEKLILEETKKLLLTINDIYKELNIRYNARKILPLENMETENSGQVHLAPIPEERGTYKVEVSSSVFGSEYEDRYYHKSDLKPLWKKYQREFKDLGIDVKKYSRYYESEPHFEICVNLRDISDLPIDYEKITLLPKEELKKIIEREEGNEK